jgi:hypothetical protein
LNLWWFDVLLIVAGYILMLATGTLYSSSGVAEEQEAVQWGSPFRIHAVAVANSFLGIIAQVLLWEGVFCLYWVVCLDGSECAIRSSNWWKDLFLMAVGHMLLNFTESFIDENDAAEADCSASPTAKTTPLRKKVCTPAVGFCMTCTFIRLHPPRPSSGRQTPASGARTEAVGGRRWRSWAGPLWPSWPVRSTTLGFGTS